MERVDVAIVGGGQAGLTTSHQLSLKGVEHVVLERGRVGRSWRERWDSFCLVTPNWTVDLPDHPYDGNDPDGFMPRDEIVTYLEGYASRTKTPLREGVEVHSVESDGEGFTIQTSEGDLAARAVVLASGAYQRPHRPPRADTLPQHLLQIDVEGYTSPEALPDGSVLVVGSGQSGCQLAEELHEAGRRVVLSCGRAPWAPRRVGDRDLVWWLQRDGFFELSVEDLPTSEARLFGNVVATGHAGGHDLNLRTLRSVGVELVGHFLGASGRSVAFADDLLDSVAWGDARYRMTVQDIPETAVRLGLPVPELPEPEPFGSSGPTEVDLTGFGAAIFTSGFLPDYGDLLPTPDAVDGMGFPVQRNGASAVVQGLYFVGVHFLRKRKSSLLLGVGEDAAIVAATIANSALATSG